MDVRERVTAFVKALPFAHRVGVVAAVLVVVMLAIPFASWVTTPSYTVLYSGLDDQTLSEVIEGLEAQGVDYQLEGGGSRVLVPTSDLYTTRAALAGEGVVGRSTPAGYELLDEQGLSVSDFRQRVDYRRALEGELSKTLTAMGGIREATVHLVVPERELFAERQQPVTASVLLATARPLSEGEVEAVTFLVASSVEGLQTEHITVADADGTMLHAPGDVGGASVATNRNLRQTREFEELLAADVTRLLDRVTDGTPSSVVVRAQLDFDEEEVSTETFAPDSQVALREQTNSERFDGTGVPPGGAVGIDGGPLQMGGGESTYERDEELREFGVDSVTSRTVAAPGRVEGLSVAIVMDDGTMTGAQVPPNEEIEGLVAAALGLEADRGDDVAVTTMALEPMQEEVPEEPPAGLIDHLPEIVAAALLLLVVLALFLMSRRRSVVVESIERDEDQDALPEPKQAEPSPVRVVDAPEMREPREVPKTAMQHDVAALVERQPEEIATLLRGWLADRREVQR